MDFTLIKYKSLLLGLQRNEYIFQTFEQFLKAPAQKVLIIRHDVDRLPENALKIAHLEASIGIKGSYYFRIIPSTYKTDIICQITELGHEVGYHYETMDTYKGNVDKAYDGFCRNLDRFRVISPIKTICMHGSPLSKYDNRDIWKKYDYKNLGIIGEPYFDIDYKKVFYITDTGRKWNNQRSNVRDLVNSTFDIPIQSTGHLISLIEQGALPDVIMINTHPHRWFDGGFGWYKEFLGQKIKNVVKRTLLIIRNGQ